MSLLRKVAWHERECTRGNADPNNPADLITALHFSKSVVAFAGCSSNEFGRICRCFDTTFRRWEETKPEKLKAHPAHVAGLFEGLQFIADECLKELKK